MAFQKVSSLELADKLATAFRSHGYEGASLTSLSQLTGLEKASLYHRFPGGKDQMLDAALNHVQQWFTQNVLDPLAQPGDPAKKLRIASQRIRGFYRDGLRPCVLDTLSLHTSNDALQGKLAEALRTSYSTWHEAFSRLARESGIPTGTAKSRAEQAIVEIEGGLVVSRATASSQPFLRAIARLPALLLNT